MKHENTLESSVTAGKGLIFALRQQRSVRTIAVVAVIVTIAGIILRLTAMEYMVLSITITMVFTAELLNSAIEYTIDMVTDDYHDLAKAAKDVAAAAVLLACLNSVIVGFMLAANRLELV